jgi:hypothetical protein
MKTILIGAADDPDGCSSSAFGLTHQTSDLTPLLGASFLSSFSRASI